VEELLIKVL